MPSNENRTRVNDMIRIPEVRLVGADAQQIGVVPTHIAKQMAQEQGLDLVEVAPMARPPVCRIMDFGKYRFELAKKDKASKAKQHIVKVKASVMFRGREMAHMDYGRRLLDQMVKDLEGIAILEQAPVMEGRTMGLLLAPGRKKSVKAEGDAPASEPATAPEPVANLSK